MAPGNPGLAACLHKNLLPSSLGEQISPRLLPSPSLLELGGRSSAWKKATSLRHRLPVVGRKAKGPGSTLLGWPPCEEEEEEPQPPARPPGKRWVSGPGYLSMWRLPSQTLFQCFSSLLLLPLGRGPKWSCMGQLPPLLHPKPHPGHPVRAQVSCSAWEGRFLRAQCDLRETESLTLLSRDSLF